MSRPLLAPLAAVTLAALSSTVSATQIRYELQGVFDSLSPEPVALIGGFTFDTATSSFSDVTVQFASNPVLGTVTAQSDVLDVRLSVREARDASCGIRRQRLDLAGVHQPHRRLQ